MTEEKRKLTNKQRLFIDYYLQSFNASDAARKAGYSERTAYSIGSRLLKDVEVSAEIQERLSEVHMSADEALKLTADIARGDITQFFTQYGNIDWDTFRESGKGRLVKKVKTRTITKIGKGATDDDVEIVETELELYPADNAQDRVLKVTGTYKELGTKENPTNVKVLVEYVNSQNTTAGATQSAGEDQE